MRLILRSLTLAICLTVTASAQTQNGEWRADSGDRGSTKYAALDQIDRTNVKELQIAWRRPAVDPLLINKDPKLQVSNNFRATPLMVNGVLYSPNGIGLVEALIDFTPELAGRRLRSGGVALRRVDHRAVRRGHHPR